MKRQATDPEEIAFIEQYKKDVQSGKFPVQCITVDPVVFWRNKVLLVRRKNWPSKGYLALPGGFVNENETLLDAVKRECEEETGLILQEGWLFKKEYFDDPDRAPAVRILTHAFAFDIPYYLDYTKHIKAADDAEDAMWLDVLDVLDLDPKTLHDDHYWIISEMYSRRY